MAIKIDISSSSISATVGKPVTLRLGDSGKARVSMNISIGEDISVDFEETWTGVRETVIPPLPRGKYPCFVFLYAFRSGLGATYDSLYEINGETVAEARGALTDGVFNDGGNAKFTLVVN